MVPPVRRAASAAAAVRYLLTRELGAGPTICFVMLNPSTADATTNDPTIRRTIGFARREGAGRLLVVNLWSRRATRPADLRLLLRPGGGAKNDRALLDAADAAEHVVVAWGVHGAWRGRDRTVARMLDRPLLCLGTTRDGHPRHPLYVRADQPLVAWDMPHSSKETG
ncbi:MAG: DUF1643 domain-containing protein [Proteobacteria bacterium]|nr:DUF1643 domain-containing protein [Pseudomonadota bacterium]MCP4919761.1 DUF1643 domain-containing protein [Pseudomonadota bacterium]